MRPDRTLQERAAVYAFRLAVALALIAGCGSIILTEVNRATATFDAAVNIGDRH